jgi:transcriptional regulator of met regulon
MRLFDGQIIKSETPQIWEERYAKSLLELPFNWSLYELVAVHCITVDALPSDEDIWKEINARIPDEYYAQETGKIINRYKSKILKP